MPTNTMMGKNVVATSNNVGTVVGMKVGGKNVGSICLVSYTNEAGLILTPGTSETVISDVVLIPANTLKSGDKLQFVFFAEDAGTADAAARGVRVRMHTTSSVISGQLLTSMQIGTATNTKYAADKAVGIVGTTKTFSTSSGNAGGVMSATALVSATIDTTVDNYIGITALNANTLVNFIVYHAAIHLEKVQ